MPAHIQTHRCCCNRLPQLLRARSASPSRCGMAGEGGWPWWCRISDPSSTRISLPSQTSHWSGQWSIGGWERPHLAWSSRCTSSLCRDEPHRSRLHTTTSHCCTPPRPPTSAADTTTFHPGSRSPHCGQLFETARPHSRCAFRCHSPWTLRSRMDRPSCARCRTARTLACGTSNAATATSPKRPTRTASDVHDIATHRSCSGTLTCAAPPTVAAPSGPGGLETCLSTMGG
mmetsp:Transcript_29075/g.76163  ORF Transcript_29075/g.76163 Transcript_29075/m.76163 type:complete len:230 (+) Transcript_29075:473-1162(+)